MGDPVSDWHRNRPLASDRITAWSPPPLIQPFKRVAELVAVSEIDRVDTLLSTCSPAELVEIKRRALITADRAQKAQRDRGLL